ncbi:MAG TPA: phosphatidylglycerol lysyltransferase domain-containing protein [Sulfuricaulis sp.]|nr:phosphatidylglycerol lysyltransferase domain-containing protein [Sulfuricaulis sp.]
MALAPGFVPMRSLPSLFPSLVLRRITRWRYVEEKKVLSQNEEPPRSLTEKHITDRLVPAPVLTLHSNELLPRHYLAVENHRLYPFTIDAKPLFDHYVRHIPTPLSDYTFANNIIWLSQKSGFYQIIEGCFCLFSLNGHCLTMLLPPLGKPAHQVAALDACSRIMDGYNPTAYLSAVEYVYRDFTNLLEASQDRWLIERSLPDYIYRTEDLVQLKGNAYKTKRGEINQFRRVHPDHRLERLGPQHEDGIRELIDTWLRNRLQYMSGDAIADFFYTVEQERRAIERALTHYDTLGLKGLCLFINERLEGFTFGERITPDVANVLVEKTNFAIPGSAQFLFREFVKEFTDCTFINVGDDLGLENLRRVKMSYRPALFGEKISLRRAGMHEYRERQDVESDRHIAPV